MIGFNRHIIYSIEVQKSLEYLQERESPHLLSRNFNSSEEFQSVINLLDNKKRISWLRSLMIPVRTDNKHNFCKKFFLAGSF